MDKKISGERIKKAIKEAGYTQEEFAKEIKTGRSMISQWIIGKRNPKRESLEKIAEATGKPLQYFFNNSNIASGGDNSNVVGKGNNINSSAEVELLKKDIEILKLQIELLKKDKKK